VLIGLDLSRFKRMPADLPKLTTRHGPDQAVTTFADVCLLGEGQTVDWGLDTWVEKLQLDPARRTRNMQIIERCAHRGVDNGLVLAWKPSRRRQDQPPVRGWGGQRGSKQAEPQHRTRWDVHRDGPSLGLTTASLPGVVAAIAPEKIPLPKPLTLLKGAEGQKSSLERV
jgi:hypothetical protein